jgi:dTDP-4-dehydrorhamnose 3,5-epimerase
MSNKQNIEGVVITPLRQIPDERGKIMHMLRADADHYKGFGEIYSERSISPA